MDDIESKCTVKVNSGQLSVKLNGHSLQMERSESIKVQKLTVHKWPSIFLNLIGPSTLSPRDRPVLVGLVYEANYVHSIRLSNFVFLDRPVFFQTVYFYRGAVLSFPRHLLCMDHEFSL